MIEAFAYCDEVMVEKFVAGTELAISVIDLGGGPVALPAVEIVPESGSFGYNERYTPGQTDYFVPARLPATTLEAAAELATTAHSALRLRHLSRIDVIVDEDGTPWFLEANVTPGMTETSLLPQSVVASGQTLPETYLSLVQAALR